jgi:hypothetical protein
MSPQLQPTDRYRYLKAKLRIFSSGRFWLSMGGFSLISIFSWQYFTHPEWLNMVTDAFNKFKTTQLDDNSTADSDSEINHDELGQLVLDHDLTQKELNLIESAKSSGLEKSPNEINSILTIPGMDFSKSSGNKSNNTDNNKRSLPQVTQGENTNNLIPNNTNRVNSITNPFVTQAQSALSTASLLNPVGLSANQVMTDNPQGESSPPTTNITNYNSPVSPNNNNLGNNQNIGINYSNNNVNYVSSSSYLNQGQSPSIITTSTPLTAPIPQGNPVSVNTNYVINTNSVTNTNINSAVPVPVYMGNSQVQPSQVQSSQMMQITPPVNTNRNIPGRNIGNGEINTFSNP